MSVDQRFVITGQDLASDGYYAVAVMIVEEIGEGLSADQELAVTSIDLACGFGKGKSKRREAG